MDKEEWLRRCADRYMERARVGNAEAKLYAQQALRELLDRSFAYIQPFIDENSPEDEADADMDCWTDDGE